MKALFLNLSPLSVGFGVVVRLFVFDMYKIIRRRTTTTEDHLKPALTKEIMRKCHAKRYRGI